VHGFKERKFASKKRHMPDGLADFSVEEKERQKESSHQRKLASKIASKNGQISRARRTFPGRAVAELDPSDSRSRRKNRAKKERSSGGIDLSRRHYLVGGREPLDHAPGIAKEDRAKR
jgi:hypothetical protein